MFFKNIKAKYLWIATAVVFLITVLLIILLATVPSKYSKVITVFMVIGFVLMTFLIQAASFKSFKFKSLEENANPVVYETDKDIIETLRKNKYKEREREYGISFLKIAKPNAYKVTVVLNSEAYFAPKEENETEGDKELDKCDKMIGFEIFLNYSPEDVKKFKDYSIQGNNIYYTCFYKKDDSSNEYVLAHYIEPNTNHERNFNYLLEELGLKKQEESKE